MSAEVLFPHPRVAADDLPPQPVEMNAVGADVALGCTGCSTELRLPLEPVPPMLDAVGDFVRRHALCR
ncbi:MAG: hypothetical protein QOE05_2352 [Actinomycetota bacterium]|jgi:hypothetical protein|nr:hypothetical protein [Actinomycetota bacterium]